MGPDQERDWHGRWVAASGVGQPPAGLPAHHQTLRAFAYRAAQALYDRLARHRELVASGAVKEHGPGQRFKTRDEALAAIDRALAGVHPGQFAAEHEAAVRAAVANGSGLRADVARDYTHLLPGRPTRADVRVIAGAGGTHAVVPLPGGAAFEGPMAPADAGHEHAKDRAIAALARHRLEEYPGWKGREEAVAAAVHPLVVPQGRPEVVASDGHTLFAVHAAPGGPAGAPLRYYAAYRDDREPAGVWHRAGKGAYGSYDEAARALARSGMLGPGAAAHDPVVRRALAEKEGRPGLPAPGAQHPQPGAAEKVLAHVAGPSGSGKTTLAGELKKRFPALAVHDLDDFDDEAVRQLGWAGVPKQKYTDDMLAKLAERRQRLLDETVASTRGQLVLVGHHTEGQHALKIPTSNRFLLDTDAKTSAARAYDRSQSEAPEHRRTREDLPRDEKEAQDDIDRLKGMGYQPRSAEQVLDWVGRQPGARGPEDYKRAEAEAAKMRGKRASLEVETPSGRRAVSALRFGGLAVHRSTRNWHAGTDSAYTVTHAASGQAVGHAATQKDARTLTHLLRQTGVDWDRDAESVRSQRDKVVPVLRAFQDWKRKRHFNSEPCQEDEETPENGLFAAAQPAP